ncbi:MAG: hypothetical protein PHC84_05730, partial [Clostridia bacterium]|nr:hypothetical protein [Clostridia bacterium]
MVKQRKGIFRLLIVAGIILTMLFIGIQTGDSAYAADGQWSDFRAASLSLQDALEPNGPSNPYVISTAEELALLSYNVNNGQKYINTYFLQTADIDLSAHNFLPIGLGLGNEFDGIYDGGGFDIAGLSISLPTSDGLGLFGNVSTTVSETDEAGTLRNINIVGGGILGKTGVGSIAGSFVGKKIENCSSSARLYSGAGTTENFGGIAGFNFGVIERSYFFGVIDASMSTSVGGIAGINGIVFSDRSAQIKDCFNAGEINGYSDVGGIAGSNYGNITRVYNTGNIEAYNRTGGLVGYHEGGLSEGYNTGGLLSGSGYVGAIIGFMHESSDAERLYYLKSDSNNVFIGHAIGADGLSIAGATDSPSEDIFGLNYYEIINISESMLFYGEWVYSQSVEGFGYAPYIQGLDSAVKEYAKLALYGGDILYASRGEEASQYILSSPYQFGLLANNTNNNEFSYTGKYFDIFNDIDFSAISDYAPVGTQNCAFEGTISGNGYTLSGLALHNEDNAALFAYTVSAVFYNIVIDGFEISGGNLAAALVADADGGAFIGIQVTGSQIDSTGSTGGAVGSIDLGLISNCHTGDTSISGSISGGIVGTALESPLTDCSSSALVAAQIYAGGICGEAQNLQTSQCRFTGEVSAQQCAGGIAGFYANGSIDTSFVFSSVVWGEGMAGGLVGNGISYIIDTSYVVSDVGSDIYAAGFVGGSGEAPCQINNSYFVGAITGEITGAGAAVTNGAAVITDVYFNSDFIKNTSVI